MFGRCLGDHLSTRTEGAESGLPLISGTGARPVLQALPDDLRAHFVSEYQKLLNEAYPAKSYGTVLPFRRVFVVAHRGTTAASDVRRVELDGLLLITDPQADQAAEVAMNHSRSCSG
jgi:hypothetical protein